MTWERCKHGYNVTPSHKCPWCFGFGDDSKFTPVVGEGNGWLLHAEGPFSIPCDGCGGPRAAGWGAWASPDKPTPERVYEQLLTMRFCLECCGKGLHEQHTSKKGEHLTADELRCFYNHRCPDCGKLFESNLATCPRPTCGSQFRLNPAGWYRWTDAHPDRPPRPVVKID